MAGAWAPRPDDIAIGNARAEGKEYLHLFRIQRATALKWGHRHVVYGDADVPGCDVVRVPLERSFSRSIVRAQLAAVEAWDGLDHLVLVDADVAIARDLTAAFDGTFDFGLTNRNVPQVPLNNGVMYCHAGSREVCVALFKRALECCATAWGEDQQALNRVLKPVPLTEYGVRTREVGGLKARIAFLPCGLYNMTPNNSGQIVDPAFAIHFKGNRKRAMIEYAKDHMGVIVHGDR